MLKPVDIIVAPFHAGAYEQRVGKGPHRLLDAGLVDAARVGGRDIRIIHIDRVDAFEGEIGRSFEIKRRVSVAVAAAAQAEHFPVVLAGNCNVSVGVYAGLSDPDVGIVWFDAHPDFDTPEDAMSGYLDGMGVTTLAGQCWQKLASTIPGFNPFDLSKLIYCGIRDFDPGQREKVQAHRIKAVEGSVDRQTDFEGSLATELGTLPDRCLVHVDLDCLDTGVGYANEYAASGGLSVNDLLGCLRLVTRRKKPEALTIASFNPDCEGNTAIADAGIRAVAEVLAAVN